MYNGSVKRARVRQQGCVEKSYLAPRAVYTSFRHTSLITFSGGGCNGCVGKLSSPVHSDFARNTGRLPLLVLFLVLYTLGCTILYHFPEPRKRAA